MIYGRASAAKVLTAVMNAGTLTIYENGTQKATGTVATGSTNGVNLRLGMDGTSGIGENDAFGGDIVEGML